MPTRGFDKLNQQWALVGAFRCEPWIRNRWDPCRPRLSRETGSRPGAPMGWPTGADRYADCAATRARLVAR